VETARKDTILRGWRRTENFLKDSATQQAVGYEALPLYSVKEHSGNCAPHCDVAGPPTAPAVVPSNAGQPIAAAIIPPALAVPAIYVDSPHLSQHRSEILSSGDMSLLQVAWTDLTPSLDHQDTILAVNRRFRNSLAPLPSAADARRAQANEVSAAAAFETAQTLASELTSAPQRGFLRILNCTMARRFPDLALECGVLKPSDANTTVDMEKTFKLWQRQIVTECSVATTPTFSALLQLARRMTCMTRQHKQAYKKDPEIEDIVNWTTGVDEVLDGDKIEVDRVPVDANLIAAIEALQFAMEDRYSVHKLDLTSEAHSAR